jgi:hypothetical protein
MPRDDEGVREVFGWGVLWTIVLLIVAILAAGYYLWYKPTIMPRTANHSGASVLYLTGGAT